MNIYGLIGKNIAYSFSKNYFINKFKNEGIKNSQYINFDIDNLSELNNIFNQNNQGYNVTIPYKEAVISYLDALDNHAKQIGAVNTIQVHKGQKKGFNTDWIGFKKSIEPLLQLHHTKALILGSGGASKAVIYALKQLQITTAVVSRTKGDFTYQQLDEELLKEHTIIINTTPLGTFPETSLAPVIPYQFISKQHLVYDLVYNPEETLFLKKCRKNGAEIKNGLQMLEIQAEEAWKIWNSGR